MSGRYHELTRLAPHSTPYRSLRDLLDLLNGARRIHNLDMIFFLSLNQAINLHRRHRWNGLVEIYVSRAFILSRRELLFCLVGWLLSPHVHILHTRADCLPIAHGQHLDGRLRAASRRAPTARHRHIDC